MSLRGRRQRELITILALRLGRPVSAEALAISIYGDPLPKTATESVRMHVTALRRAVGTVDPGLDIALRTTSPGYLLDATMTQTDLTDAERLVDAAEQAVRAGDAVNALRRAEQAADLWRGEPLTEFEATPFGPESSPSLLALHARCLKIMASAALSVGSAEVEAALVRLSRRQQWHPWDEALVGLLAHCQYRVGQQQAALRTLADHRAALVEDLGLDPSTDLLRLEQSILNQDEWLAAPMIQRQPFAASRTGRVLGRDRDLAAITRAVSDAAVRLVLVGGPGGMGKTTVLREIALRHNALLINARPDDGPYEALRRALRGAPADAASPSRAVFAEQAPNPSLIVNPLLHQLHQGPDVVVVDDADQLDDGSVSILQRAVSEADSAVTVVMGSRRPGTLLTAWVATGADLRVVHLQDLEDNALADIASSHLPQVTTSEVGRHLPNAGGNPGRLLDLLATTVRPSTQHAPTPRLRADVRRVVEAVAAVAPLSASELGAVLSMSSAELMLAVATASEQALIDVGEETITLGPSQLARRLQAELGESDTRRLHRAMAAYLATSIRHSDAVRRGRHLQQAGDTLPAQVVGDGLLVAVRSAITLGWFDVATELATLGLARTDLDGAHRLSLSLEQARVRIAIGDTQTAAVELREVYRAAAAQAMPDLATMALLCLQSLGVTVGGDTFLLDSWRWLTGNLLPDAGELRTRALCGAAYACLTGEQPQVAVDMLDRAEEAHPLTPTEVAMVSHARLLTSRMCPDPHGVAREQLTRLQLASLQRSEPEIEVRMRLDRVILALDEGDVETASSSLRGMTEMADAMGHPQARWISRAALATVALCAGDYDQAAARSIEAAEVGTSLGVPETVISGAAFQLALHERRGELPQLRPLLEAMSDPPDTIAVAWHSGAALAALAVGDDDGAQRHWSRIRDRARVFKPSLLAVPGDYLAAQAAAAVGDLPTALLLADRLRPIEDRFVVVGSAVAVFGPVARVLALVAEQSGDFLEATRYWELNDQLCGAGALAWHTGARQ